MKKKNNKYILFLIIFIVLMIIILFFFMNRITNIRINNQVNKLLVDSYSLDTGEYSLKNGIIYTNSDFVISDKVYLPADGKIYVDNYKNISLVLNYNNKCITKTYMGNIKISNECDSFRKIEINIIKNNSKVSFNSNVSNLEYKISNKDDFKGEWVKPQYKDNIVLKYFNEGKNYIWFKDSDGNLSDVIEFNVDCLNTSKAVYDKNVFYCSGSTVVLDNMVWIVIKDNNSTIQLMKQLPLDEKMSQCLSEESNYCFYTKTNKNTYNWSNSYVNYYLNNIFINELSQDTRDKLITNYICDDINSVCAEESCIGRNKQDINNNNYSCSSYTESKIKLISYDEFNYLYTYSKNMNVLEGNYYSINSFNLDKCSNVQYDLSFYVLSNPSDKLDIKPVILLNK